MLTIHFQSTVIRSLSLLIFMSLVASQTEAEEKSKADNIEYRGGIRNSNGEYRLEPKYLNLLLASLQEKTGFTELSVDSSDYLVIKNKEVFVGGSRAARKLLIAAIEGLILFNLENHNGSGKVSFARLDMSTVFRNIETKKEVDVRPLMLDFFDYDHLIGEKENRHSFDVGMNTLHELAHGVYRLRDDVENKNDLGECENFVNTIRRDLNLPQRERYIAWVRQSVTAQGQIALQAELQFSRSKVKNRNLKTETLVLSWDTRKVGFVTPEAQLSSARATSMKATIALR